VSFYTRQADELRRRGRVRADHARYLAGRLDKRALLRRAWTLARAGGTVRAYFAEALRQSWAETKARLAVARGMAEDRYALTVVGLLVLREAEAAREPTLGRLERSG
jgi:hypothetical protein